MFGIIIGDLDVALRAIRDYSQNMLPLDATVLLLATLPTLLWYVIAWLLWGRDRPLGPVAPLYSPPEDISPGLASTLLRVQPRVAFVAAILSLMSKNCLTLGHDGYLCAEKDAPDLPLPDEEQTILDSIGKGWMVPIDDGGEGLYKTYSLFTRKCSALYRKYMDQNRRLVAIGALIQVAAMFLLTPEPNIVLPLLILPTVYVPFLVLALKYMERGRTRNLTVLFLSVHCLIMGTIIMGVFRARAGAAELLFLAVLVFLVMGMHGLFYWILDKPGSAAVKMLTKLEGLRMFIATADANRYAMFPPNQYDKNLPYAVIFGYELAWLERFSSLEGVLPWSREGKT